MITGFLPPILRVAVPQCLSPGAAFFGGNCISLGCQQSSRDRAIGGARPLHDARAREGRDFPVLLPKGEQRIDRVRKVKRETDNDDDVQIGVSSSGGRTLMRSTLQLASDRFGVVPAQPARAVW